MYCNAILVNSLETEPQSQLYWQDLSKQKGLGYDEQVKPVLVTLGLDSAGGILIVGQDRAGKAVEKNHLAI